MPLMPITVPAPAPAPEPPPDSGCTGPAWGLAGRVAFRFALAYLVLYILPFPLPTIDSLQASIREIVTGKEPDPEQPSPITEYLTKPYRDFWDKVVLRTGKEVFGVEIEYRPAGSGDTTWNYVQLFDFAVLAAALTLVWTLAAGAWWAARGRGRLGYPHLHEWLRVYVRFYLAQTMFVYGAFKIIKLQFRYPGPDAMLHTFGESSPMHLLWTFMGASDSYTWFTGAGEILGGLLLTTRRTTLLGALVTFGVMVHVAALNYCYDVPVKLFSTHLVLMSVFLMAPDLPWLARVFVLGRSDAPRGYTPLVRRPWLDWTLFVVRSLAVLTFVGVTLHRNHEASKLFGRGVPEPPLFGVWEVEEFALDGQVRPPLTTDADRWQRVYFRKPVTFRRSNPGKPTVGIVSMTGKPVVAFAEVEVDEEKKTITLSRPSGAPGGAAPGTTAAPAILGVLRYREVEPEVIEVEGEVPFAAGGTVKHVKARLRHYGPDKFLLSSRGFHWINEMPYNQFGPRTDPPPKIPPPPKQP